MKELLVLLFVSVFLSSVSAQKADTLLKKYSPRHLISFNSFNYFLFQQAGLSYEYKGRIMGYGISTGYIYPNKAEYKNFFKVCPVFVTTEVMN